MTKFILILFLLSFFGQPSFCQKGKQKIITDNDRQFIYTKEGGVTQSYISYFGSRYDLPELKTIDGKLLDDKFFKGKTVVLNFWFTACKPCIAEIPSLNSLYKRYESDSIVFIGITFDDTLRIKKFLETTDFRFRIASLTQEAISTFKKISFYPLTIILNKHGIIRYVIFGRPEGKKQEEEIFGLLDNKLESIIKE